MYRKEIISYLLSIFLVFVAGILHAMDYFSLINFPVHTIIFCLYTTIIFLWLRNMNNRVLRASVVRRFKTIGILLIFYLAFRTLKYEILLENPMAVRYIRYFYYVFPIILIQLVFLTSLFVGKSERENISDFWKLLWAPTGILVILILTNDIHGLVFSLDESSRGLNQYGPVFYFGIIYIGILALLTLSFTMIPYITRGPISTIVPSISILLIWGLYTFLYMLGWQPFEYFKMVFKSAEFNILMVILFIESLVFKRLIPSNRGYESFLKMSSLNIGIMDLDENIIFTPKNYPNIEPKLINKAYKKPILLNENTLLESAGIKGGKSFWFVDLTDFNKLKKKLMQLNEEMLSENELLKANNKLKKNMVKVQEQKEIREYIQLKLEPQFEKLKYIMKNLPEDEVEFEKTLKYACILDVYIKRYANLFLLTKNKKNLDLSELRLAFSESLDYLELSQVRTDLDWRINRSFDAKICLKLYEIFQNILETYQPHMSSISLIFADKRRRPELKIKVISSKTFSIFKELEKNYRKEGILIHENFSGDQINWTISIERGALWN